MLLHKKLLSVKPCKPSKKLPIASQLMDVMPQLLMFVGVVSDGCNRVGLGSLDMS